MGKTVPGAVSTTALLKREDYKSTKHDYAFSQWKILIAPCDWEDYLLNKEGAERYRIHNLPNCSSCSGLYELGIAVSLPEFGGKSSGKLSSKRIIPVYLGQADNVRNRLQQYGRDGAHLENGCSSGEPNGRKVLGLFSDVFSNGFAIAYRWAAMESKKDAEKTESQLLKTFDYAWNRGMNKDRRPNDILQKLEHATSTPKTLPQIFKKLQILPPKKAGIKIKRCKSPTLENGSSFYTKQEGTNILSRIFKFSRSRPVPLSKEFDIDISDANTCGVALGHGAICRRPPVEGRKRCVDHKGMKVNAFVRPRLPSGPDDIRHLTCGVTLDDASHCTKAPVAGRKRCEKHKGMRINKPLSHPFIAEEKHHIPRSPDVESAVNLGRNSCEEHKGIRVNGKSRFSGDMPRMFSDDVTADKTLLTCGAITLDGSFCKRKPCEDSKLCWQHESIRAKLNHPSYKNPKACSSSCGAPTKKGTLCSRRTTGGERCFQH